MIRFLAPSYPPMLCGVEVRTPTSLRTHNGGTPTQYSSQECLETADKHTSLSPPLLPLLLLLVIQLHQWMGFNLAMPGVNWTAKVTGCKPWISLGPPFWVLWLGVLSYSSVLLSIEQGPKTTLGALINEYTMAGLLYMLSKRSGEWNPPPLHTYMGLTI